MKYELLALLNSKWVGILVKSNSITWGSDKDTLAVDLNFNTLTDIAEGAHIQLKINSKITFTGILVKKSKSSNLIYACTCFSYEWYLNKNETIIQFNKINASDSIKQLCSKFGIKCNVVQIDFIVQDEKKSTVKSKVDTKVTSKKTGKVTIAKRVKNTKITTLISKVYKDMTLSAIIEDILEQAELEIGIKYIKEMIGDTLYIRKQNEYKIFPKFILSKDLTLNSSIEEMKNKILVVSSDEANNKILASASDTKSIKIYGGLQEVITLEVKDIAKAKNMANNSLKTNNKIFRDTTLNIIVIESGEEIRANRMIGLSIKSKGLSGWYNIKSVSSTLENGQMKSTITLEW